jgi:hypothetical protein
VQSKQPQQTMPRVFLIESVLPYYCFFNGLQIIGYSSQKNRAIDSYCSDPFSGLKLRKRLFEDNHGDCLAIIKSSKR